ncbi:MAG: hypothetical protein L0H59_10200 [Tomitella sp.]|nr:hypothetical protein [Tomitella sp.]
MATIETVREHYNIGLEMLGVVLNKVPPRSREADFRTSELAAALGDQHWYPVVPMRTILTESRGARDLIHSYGSRATGLIEIFDEFREVATS